MKEKTLIEEIKKMKNKPFTSSKDISDLLTRHGFSDFEDISFLLSLLSCHLIYNCGIPEKAFLKTLKKIIKSAEIDILDKHF